MTKVKCEDCRFWEPGITNNGIQAGECRRKSPERYETPMGRWPRTFDNDWCGEFEPEKAPEAESFQDFCKRKNSERNGAPPAKIEPSLKFYRRLEAAKAAGGISWTDAQDQHIPLNYEVDFAIGYYVPADFDAKFKEAEAVHNG